MQDKSQIQPRVHCLVDGCPWMMESETELREDGESVIDLHLNAHKIDELQNAARNGMLFSLSDDPLQGETAQVYIKAFLEWIKYQNEIEINEGHSGEDLFIRVPLVPTDEEIFGLVDSFIELDYRFGN